jgi:hypothetical protein
MLPKARSNPKITVQLEVLSVIDLLRHMKVTSCSDHGRTDRLRELYSYLRYATRAQTGIDPEE